MTAHLVNGKSKRPLSRQASELVAQFNGPVPVWVRAPVRGCEFFSGLRRSKLYELAGAGKIRSVSLKEPGRIKGVRLFHLGSIFEYVARFEAQPTVATAPTAKN